jgi:hypothetical protein
VVYGERIADLNSAFISLPLAGGGAVGGSAPKEGGKLGRIGTDFVSRRADKTMRMRRIEAETFED